MEVYDNYNLDDLLQEKEWLEYDIYDIEKDLSYFSEEFKIIDEICERNYGGFFYCDDVNEIKEEFENLDEFLSFHIEEINDKQTTINYLDERIKLLEKVN